MELAPVNAETRRRFSLRDNQRGVVITRVESGTNAAEKRLQAGDVIVEVAQEAVGTAQEVADRVERLKRDGRRAALLTVANAQGELRFVAVTIE